MRFAEIERCRAATRTARAPHEIARGGTRRERGRETARDSVLTVLAQPALEDANHVCALLGGELVPRRDAMPFLEAGAAAGRGAMLRDEHGMPAPWRLLAVVLRLRRRQSSRDEVLGVAEDDGQTLQPQVFRVGGAEAELRAEGSARERREEIVEVTHRGAAVVTRAT